MVNCQKANQVQRSGGQATREEQCSPHKAPGPGLEAGAAALQAITGPQPLSPGGALALQRAAGNRAVSCLIQAKLAVGPANDRYEQEADRVAERVLSMPAGQRPGVGSEQPGVQLQGEEEEVQTRRLVQRASPLEEKVRAKRLLQRQGEEEEIQTKRLLQRQWEEEEIQTRPLLQRQWEEEEIQTKATARDPESGFDAGPNIEKRLAGTRGGGSPLPEGVRSFMEPRFGADLAGVRVHADSKAAQLNRELSAQAFTHGPDIYMGEGRYAPGTAAGDRLLAHELTHVVQQGAVVQTRCVLDEVQPAPVAEGTLARQGLVQRVVVPFRQVHRDWNLADKQVALDATLGFSPPWLNGTLGTSTSAVVGALVKPQISVAAKGENQYEAEVYSAPVNAAGSEMWLPKAGPWQHAEAPKDMMASWASVHPKKPGGTITVEVSGIPNHKRLSAQVEAHENVHASDNKRVIDQVLGTWDARLEKARAEGTKFAGRTPAEAESALYQAAGGTAAEIGARLDHDWGQASDDYHDTPEGKTVVDDAILDEKRGKLTLRFHLTAKV